MNERLQKNLSQWEYEPPIQEACGIVAIWTANESAPEIARSALATLQHRGQESAGITTYTKGGTLITHTGMGLVPQVLKDEIIYSHPSHIAIAHNRYSTTGASVESNAQPFTLSDGEHALSIGHNGNLTNTPTLSTLLSNRPSASSDTAHLTSYLLQERRKHSTWEETFLTELPNIEGAYCLVMLTEDRQLFAARDPHEIRPMSLGKLKDGNGWIIASETVALDNNNVGADFLRTVKGGELIHIDADGNMKSSFFGNPASPKHCLFEEIYFLRPDSFSNKQRVRTGREKSGRLLAQRMNEKGIHSDVVVPIFDSGYPAAKGFAEETGLPTTDAITVSHYVGRTFINPGQSARISGVNGKFNITPDNIIDREIITVDDSAVRMTTSTSLNHRLTASGAKSVNNAFASPPVINHCDLGVDMRSKDLPASTWKGQPLEIIEKKVAEFTDAKSVTFLPFEETAKAFGNSPDSFCHFCFGGEHPMRGKSEFFSKKEKIIKGKARLSVLISGDGTNLQEIIDSTKSGDIDAEIVCVVSNKPDAHGLVRAGNSGIPTKVIPSFEQLKDFAKRKNFEEKLFSEIEKTSPDIIILAGWMVVLSDNFIAKFQQLETPIINLHPALLTSDNSINVRTSQGETPVIRGSHAIEDAYSKKLRVSGVTVHQVTAGPFDTGPIILQEEIRRIEGESLEGWTQRVHVAEHRILPSAVKRVIHVMKHGINVADGKFPW